MIQSSVEIRVRYAETDRMGFVYYGNYSTYFEVARVEMLRNLGISYKELEDKGISLPVLEYRIKYLKPAFYDQLLTISTKITTLPAARIRFEYETRNESGDLLNVAETTLVFINSQTLKPCSPPDYVISKMISYFS
jgi:acyl-CoA thioester hydrolase